MSLPFANLQVKHRQTRKCYGTYNALLEIKELMQKETSLLNSIISQVLIEWRVHYKLFLWHANLLWVFSEHFLFIYFLLVKCSVLLFWVLISFCFFSCIVLFTEVFNKLIFHGIWHISCFSLLEELLFAVFF